MIRRMLILFLIGMFLLTACGPEKLPPTITPTPAATATPLLPKEVKLDEDGDGRQIELNQGQILVVSLGANPSTGYTWEITEIDERVLRQVGEIKFEPQSDLLGAPGKQILHFEVVGEGQSTLKLVYHRPWEKGVEPVGTFSVQVIVR